MTLLGKHGSLNKFFKKTKKWGGRMFQKVKGGLSKAKMLLDNPVVHAGASYFGLGDLHSKAMGLLDKAHHHVGNAEDKYHHLVGRAERVGDSLHTLGQSVKEHGKKAHEGARGLGHHSTDTAFGKYTHDLAHMAEDTLQKVKAVKRAAENREPEITFHD